MANANTDTFNVDYKVLKLNIEKACHLKNTNRKTEFYIDFPTLVNLVRDMGLTPVNVAMESRRVHPEDIPYLSEYFEKTRLSWFSDEKQFTNIVFFRTDKLDDEARAIIKKMEKPQEVDPEDDKVEDLAALVAKYPCYFATIASYKNDDPKMENKPCCVIVCRANKVVIKSSDYQYNAHDMS